MTTSSTKSSDISAKSAFKFVILFGVISLFADMAYEGARSITGPYLAVLGASATAVGFVAGFGELVGYTLRLFSGYLVDRTHRYWPITFVGYIINLSAVPLLALAGRWEIAAALIIMERAGKALRNPARDTMLSHATQRMGRGLGFGIHETLDKIGAMSGPLLVALILFIHNDYRLGFAVLFIPALVAIIILIIAARLYPHPQNLEIKLPDLEAKGIPKIFWLYLTGSALIAAGYADFALIAYHFEKIKILSDVVIPLSYALAMGVAAITALIFGHLYDRLGFKILLIVVVISACFAPLVFLTKSYWVLLGMVCWGIGMGTQESLMRAIVANMVAVNRRGSAYGLFNAIYGVFWFLGSVLMGKLYDIAIPAVVIFALAAQLAALPFFIIVSRNLRRQPQHTP